jgi:hypothetical protein
VAGSPEIGVVSQEHAGHDLPIAASDEPANQASNVSKLVNILVPAFHTIRGRVLEPALFLKASTPADVDNSRLRTRSGKQKLRFRR